MICSRTARSTLPRLARQRQPTPGAVWTESRQRFLVPLDAIDQVDDRRRLPRRESCSAGVALVAGRRAVVVAPETHYRPHQTWRSPVTRPISSISCRASFWRCGDSTAATKASTSLGAVTMINPASAADCAHVSASCSPLTQLM